MARETHGKTVAGWRRLLDSLEDKEDMPILDDYRQRLQAMYQDALTLAAQRDAHRAAKQAASEALKETLESGRKTATALRGWIKDHYGHESEGLVEFGLRPKRRSGRKRKPPE